MASFVFILCALTALLCSGLLLRGYSRSRVRLLLWSGICFFCLAINNVLLYVDVHVMPSTDLSVIRTLPALVGVCFLIYGLIMDGPR